MAQETECANTIQPLLIARAAFSLMPGTSLVAIREASEGKVFRSTAKKNFKFMLTYTGSCGATKAFLFNESPAQKELKRALYSVMNDERVSGIDRCGRCGGTGYCGPVSACGGVCFECRGARFRVMKSCSNSLDRAIRMFISTNP